MAKPGIRITPIPRKDKNLWAKLVDKIAAGSRRELATNIVVNEFEKTVKNWEHKPKFVKSIRRTRDSIAVDVYPAGEHAFKWVIINNGLGPRMIVSGRNLMTFPRDYQARTRPGGIYGRKRRKFGPVVYKRRVVGPHTIEKRDFIGEIIKAVEKTEVGKLEFKIRKIIRNA